MATEDKGYSGDPTSVGDDQVGISRPDTSSVPLGEDTKLSYLKYADEAAEAADQELAPQNEGGAIEADN